MEEKEKELLAPEQYEMKEKPAYHFKMSRRTFLEVLGGGIAVTFTIANGWAGTAAEKFPEDQVAAWIHIGENGLVTIYTGKAEVGQNIRTSLAQIVAEELPVPLQNIEMVMGDTELTPYDRGTFGSRSIPYMGPQLRKAAASAREHLTELAATRWKTDRLSVRIENGIVTNLKSKEKINIGQLTEGKKLVKAIDDKVVLKPVSAWKIA